MTPRERAKQLYDAGHSPKEIERLTGGEITASKVRAWKSRHKWGPAPSGKESVAQQKAQQKTQRNVSPPSLDERLIDAVEENTELTDAQKAFCLHYSRTFNATASYLRAYPNACYNTANTEGPALLVNPCIRAEIQRLKKIRQLDMMASADDVVERMMRIAFADLTDFVEWGRAEVPVMSAFGPVQVTNPEDPDGPKISLTKQVNEVRFRESTEVDGTLVAEVKQGRDGASVKTHDSMKALQWLASYFELNPADVHRREYDKRRLELEAKRLGEDKEIDLEDLTPLAELLKDDKNTDDTLETIQPEAQAVHQGGAE